jgi:hypothetical protein
MRKETIETIINTSAISLSSYGTLEIISNKNYWGLTLILFGMAIEFVKYYGRRKKIW